MGIGLASAAVSKTVAAPNPASQARPSASGYGQPFYANLQVERARNRWPSQVLAVPLGTA
jgi:hypothetical protein